MTAFGWAQTLAETLIGQNGSTGTLTQVVDGVFDPISGTETDAATTTASLLCVELPMGGQDDAFLPGTLTASEAVKVMISANGVDVTPEPGDRLTLHGRTLVVEGVQHLEPDGAPIMWTLFCRQG